MQTKYLVVGILKNNADDSAIKHVPIGVFDTYQNASQYIQKYTKRKTYNTAIQSVESSELKIMEVIDNPTDDPKHLPNHKDLKKNDHNHK